MVLSQLKALVRPMYSSPPAHYAKVAGKILGDAALTQVGGSVDSGGGVTWLASIDADAYIYQMNENPTDRSSVRATHRSGRRSLKAWPPASSACGGSSSRRC